MSNTVNPVLLVETVAQRATLHNLQVNLSAEFHRLPFWIYRPMSDYQQRYAES